MINHSMKTNKFLGLIQPKKDNTNSVPQLYKTVIKGTPLHNSIKPIDVYLIAGKFDLLPKAKNIPIGKHNIKANAETINVSDNPPQAPVSTYFRPKSPPEISLNPIILVNC